MTALRLAHLAGLLLLVAGCSGPKGRAQADVDAAARALAALPPEAEKTVPDRLTPLSDAVNQGRDQLTRGDYAAASTSVSGVAEKARVIADSLPLWKAALTAQLDTLAVAMPRNLAAIQGRLDTIAKTKRVPRGLDAQQLQEAQQLQAAASAEWSEIMEVAHGGDLATAMTRARNLKGRVSRSLEALGLVSDQRAWTNVTLPPH